MCYGKCEWNNLADLLDQRFSTIHVKQSPLGQDDIQLLNYSEEKVYCWQQQFTQQELD